jgi:hypothetical protein
MESRERRRFPRLQAPVFCRPAGLRFHNSGSTIDIGLGGARVFSDEPAKPGTYFELELLLPDGVTIVCKAVVAWLDTLPEGSPAKYDLGLQFTDLDEADQQRLSLVMDTGAWKNL